MSNILAFAGSNSSTSINYQLVKYTAGLIKGHRIQTMDMAMFDLPMFSVDIEKEHGYTNSLAELRDDIHTSDGLLLSVNEHNGNPSAYFKNLVDWLSRLELNFLDGTKIFLMSTSPGKRGAASSLSITENLLPKFGGEIVATFSLPSFRHNFESGKGITDPELADKHRQALDKWLKSL
ncbi:NAD(P)H-dependent FMN reductase [Muriicola jejuensis]|uniref:NADPH-dependent FMN reductase n=1 Tax=Muriicola jejuensis TaxID=504488 RepID=A0A6P0UI09_9FLAO|nr:NAD(P)H-dependent oxidoreductase [Muriicola jejuensis]NER11419.1 NADPH-dependent FMN reductase [Muriicola jejuensis]SMP20873.1 NAD(P)H-dependent FMN reductase [Muriicola jejuensis]